MSKSPPENPPGRPVLAQRIHHGFEHKGNPPHRTDSNGFWSLEEFLQNVLWKQEGVFQKKSFGRYGRGEWFPAECSDGGGF